jgi:hypothetical protein
MIGEDYKEQLDLFRGYYREKYPVFELVRRFNEYECRLQRRRKPQVQDFNLVQTADGVFSKKSAVLDGLKASGGKQCAPTR